MMGRMKPESVTRRRPRFPWFGRNQLWLFLSLLVVLFGSMFPWWNTFLGTRYGLDSWGIYTLWAAAVGLSGVLSTKPALYRWLPLIGGAIALGVVIWVLLDTASVCAAGPDGSAPCQPAFGLILTGAGAVNTTFLAGRGALTAR